MNDAPLEPIDPANLKFLRRLVTVLTGTMIVGVLVIIALLVMRITQPAVSMPLPDSILLPDGTQAAAFTAGNGWYAVVTTDNEILIFDQTGGALRQTIQIK